MTIMALLLTLATATLVLQSGEEIAVENLSRADNGVMTFRMRGVLYSLRGEEVAQIHEGVRERRVEPDVRPLRATGEERRRLIAELEKNHSGTPAPPQPILDTPIERPSTMEVRADAQEEWAWRREARAHEEAVRRAAEDLALLEERAAQAQQKIHSLLSLGYRPHQFTYDTTVLAQTLEQIPYAKLDLERARRAYDQFREDARRQGILPGWLR